MLAFPLLAQAERAMFDAAIGRAVSGELVDMGGSGSRFGSTDRTARSRQATWPSSTSGGSMSFPGNEVNRSGWQAPDCAVQWTDRQRQPLRYRRHVAKAHLGAHGHGRPRFPSNEVRRIVPHAGAAAAAVSGTTGAPSPRAGNRRTGSGACQRSAWSRHRNHGAPRREGDVQCQRPSAVQRERQRHGDLGRGEAAAQRPTGPMANVPVGALLGRVGRRSLRSATRPRCRCRRTDGCSSA